MTPNGRTKARWGTGAVIGLSLAGIAYFVYRLLSSGVSGDVKNPYAYDLESFKKADVGPGPYAEVQRIVVDLPKIQGLAIGPDDRVYIAGDNTVLILTREGIRQSSLSFEGAARGLAVDANRDLYLALDDHVDVLGADGRKKASWESLGEKAILTSIAVSPKFVFAADAGNRIVWKFDKSGERRGRIGDKDDARGVPGFVIPSPFFDLSLDPDGFLWAANTGRHSLENFTAEGGFRTAWGEFSMDPEGFSGCCNPSHFIILSDGSFVTSEKGLVRVKVYDRLGRLTAQIAGPDEFREGTVGLDLARDSSDRIYVLDPPQARIRIFAKIQG